MVLVDDEHYQGHSGKNPFNFTRMNGLSVECTTNGVPVPKASLNLTNKYEIYDLLLNASGKNKRDAYLLDPDTFDEGFFIVPFDLTAVQDGGEASTPLLHMLVDIRLRFSSGNPTLPALFFYNTDEHLLEVDNRGTVQGPIPLGSVQKTPCTIPGHNATSVNKMNLFDAISWMCIAPIKSHAKPRTRDVLLPTPIPSTCQDKIGWACFGRDPTKASSLTVMP